MIIPLEKTIESNIIKYLNTKAPKDFNIPIRAVKWSQNGRQRGNPDIICSCDGYLFLFEVKRPQIGKLTDLQAATIKSWQASNAVAVVVTSIEEVQEHIKVKFSQRNT